MKDIKIERVKNELRIETTIFKVVINAETGMFSDFKMFDSENTQWDDIAADKLVYKNKAGISVKDCLEDKFYKDPFGRTKVFYHEARKMVNLGSGSIPECTNLFIKEEPGSVYVQFDKTYKDAAFIFQNQINIFKEHMRWDMVFKLQEGCAERSVTIEYAFPFFRAINDGYFPSGWNLWAPLEDAPYAFGHSGGWGHAQASWFVHKFPYCSTNAGAGIGIPLMDVYSTTYNSGMALMSPPDLIKPELVFITDKENSQLKLSYGNVGLRKGKEWRTSVLFYPHKGDWREALGYFHQKYNEYFKLNNPVIVENEGTMYYGSPVIPEKTLKSWIKQMKVKWTEVCFNRIFGDYIGYTDKWDFDMLWHPTMAKNNIIRGLTRDKIRDYLKMLKRNGVASYIYYNYGECDRALADEKFRDSIIHHDHGIRSAWMFRDRVRDNVTMNPDIEKAWGQFIVKQAEDIFDTYEDLDGFFIDQMCYHSYDYSCDDGVTLVENEPVYDTHRSSLAIMEKLGEILHRRKKSAFANGPYNIEIMKYADGIMSEGSLSGLAKYSYMCLEKPVMILTYCLFGEGFERVLKACLKYGAFPSTPWHHDQCLPLPPVKPPKSTQILYDKYLPLLEYMRGRKWVLSSAPVNFPAGIDGNIFERRTGGYVLPFYSSDSLLSNKFCTEKNPQIITVNLKGLEKIKEVKWLSVNFKGTKKLSVKHDGNSMKIEISRHTTASILIFE